MKTQITIEQWREITPSQAGELLEKMKLYIDFEHPEKPFTDLPDLNRMIEFLYENNNDELVKRLGCYEHTTMQGDMSWQTYSDLKGLCDDLWNDVKEALGEK